MNDMLLIGTFNSGLTGGIYSEQLPLLPLDGRAQLLYTTDGYFFDTLVDDGFGEKFTYGFRSMLASDDQLFVGTASNFFIPDFGSSLYEPYWDMFEQFLAELENCVDLPLEELEMYLAGLFDSGDPFIGTQIWASHSVPEPATMLLLGIGFVGLAGYSRRRIKKR
jgi:hypothetical protein